MKDSMNSSRPSEMNASDELTRLALDLSSSWNHSTDEIWRRLDPELWELTGNPWLILQSISRRKLDSVSDSGFRAQVEQLLSELRARNALRLGSKQRTHRPRCVR